jgi:glycosyltransferase involved in cell wall biosynthesis
LPLISVVIPTKNEEDGIGKVVQETTAALTGIDHEIVVVDSSTDRTPMEAIKAGAKVVRQIGSGGVGEALIQGFYWSRGQFIVFFDGDGTYDPQDIHKVVEPLVTGEADLVNGNRFFDIEKGSMTFTNRVGNFVLTWLGNMLFHTSIKDSQSGMKAFRKEFLTRVPLWERGFPICSEILAEASKLNLRIKEVGISYHRRIGKTKLSPTSAGVNIAWSSLKMLRDYDPLLLFAEAGLLLWIIGLLIAWPVIIEYMTYGAFTLLGRALVALFCWLAGLFSIFTGIILDAFNYTVKKIEARTGAG